MYYRFSNLAGRVVAASRLAAFKPEGLQVKKAVPAVFVYSHGTVVSDSHKPHGAVSHGHGLGDINPFILDEEDDGIVPEFYETVNPNIKPQWLVEGHQTHKTYASDNIWNYTAFTLAGVGLAFSMYRMYLVLNLNKK